MPPGLGELAKLAQQSRIAALEPAPLELARVPTRSLRRRLAPQTIDELVARYTAGESIRALSREQGVSRSGLCELLQDEGVAIREQGMTSADAEKAVRLYESGLTIRQVVDQVGYSYCTIRKVLHQNGVAMRATCIVKPAARDE